MYTPFYVHMHIAYLVLEAVIAIIHQLHAWPYYSSNSRLKMSSQDSKYAHKMTKKNSVWVRNL